MIVRDVGMRASRIHAPFAEIATLRV